MAPVWEEAALLPNSVRPVRSTTMGFTAVVRLAISMNFLPSSIPSTYIMMAVVFGLSRR